MTYEDVKNFAAFGGLILGIINLGIIIYEKFLKKAKFICEIESSYVKYIDSGYYIFQMQLAITAKGSNAWIKGVYLESSTNFIIFRRARNGQDVVSNKLSVYSALHKNRTDFLSLSLDESKKLYDTHESELVKFDNLKFEDGELKSFTLVGDLHSEQLPGEFLQMPLQNWMFVVKTGDNIFRTPFEFVPHHTTKKTAIEYSYRHEGFYHSQ